MQSKSKQLAHEEYCRWFWMISRLLISIVFFSIARPLYALDGHPEPESLFANREFWIVVLLGLSVALLVVLGMFAWNRSLKSLVNLRTQELRRQLAERKRAEEAFRESQSLLSTMIESAPFDFWAIGRDGRYILVNSVSVERYGDIVGKKPEEICHDPDMLAIWQENNRRAFGGELVKGDVKFTLAGVERFFHNIIAPIRDGDQIKGILGVNIDIAERMRMEEELRQARDELELRVRERTAELEKANEELRGFPSMLIAAQEEERKRLGAELHDSVGQTIVAVKLWVEAAIMAKDEGQLNEALGKLKSVAPTLGNAIREIRVIYTGLRPTMLDNLGLVATLRWFCKEFEKLHPEHVMNLETTIEEKDIPEELKVVIFRIAQESLNNVAKHSKAGRVTVTFSNTAGKIELMVTDNGMGMDPIIQANTVRSLGLASMRERAETTGGSFSAESTPGQGTTIRACWQV